MKGVKARFIKEFNIHRKNVKTDSDDDEEEEEEARKNSKKKWIR